LSSFRWTHFGPRMAFDPLSNGNGDDRLPALAWRLMVDGSDASTERVSAFKTNPRCHGREF